MNITFEWDATKASLNKKKHSVSFNEAKTVFFDENAIVIHDPEHSDNEERFVILGLKHGSSFIGSLSLFSRPG
jgi:uncharacterized DUF497 family protein